MRNIFPSGHLQYCSQRKSPWLPPNFLSCSDSILHFWSTIFGNTISDVNIYITWPGTWGRGQIGKHRWMYLLCCLRLTWTWREASNSHWTEQSLYFGSVFSSVIDFRTVQWLFGKDYSNHVTSFYFWPSRSFVRSPPPMAPHLNPSGCMYFAAGGYSSTVMTPLREWRLDLHPSSPYLLPFICHRSHSVKGACERCHVGTQVMPASLYK